MYFPNGRKEEGQLKICYHGVEREEWATCMNRGTGRSPGIDDRGKIPSHLEVVRIYLRQICPGTCGEEEIRALNSNYAVLVQLRRSPGTIH